MIFALAKYPLHTVSIMEFDPTREGANKSTRSCYRVLINVITPVITSEWAVKDVDSDSVDAVQGTTYIAQQSSWNIYALSFSSYTRN